MDLSGGGVKKLEDEDKGDKRDIKPVVKTLNRVPRKPTVLCFIPSAHRCVDIHRRLRECYISAFQLR